MTRTPGTWTSTDAKARASTRRPSTKVTGPSNRRARLGHTSEPLQGAAFKAAVDLEEDGDGGDSEADPFACVTVLTED